jgi:hypothetical protein
MLPFANGNMPLRWTFQQDDDPKHTSNNVKEWFLAEKVDVMKWAAQSQDLNPIKNPLIGQFGKKMEEDLNPKWRQHKELGTT